jgi:heat shock protein HslJ
MTAAAGLSGTSWLLASLNGQSPREGTTVTLNFGPEEAGKGNAGGSDGCNTYGGDYTLDGNALTFGPLISTQIACEQPIMDQATAYQKALSDTQSYRLDSSGLALLDASGSALATFTPQATGLAGTTWKVLSYNNGKEAVVSVMTGTDLTATFGTDGSLSGSAGCNNYTGAYQVTGNNVTIGPLATTRKLCTSPEGIMDQEAQYVAALQTAATYRIDGNNMELRTADNAIAATFERATATGKTTTRSTQ